MLTIHLVKVMRVDPFTFQYGNDVPFNFEAEERNPECVETRKDTSENLASIYFTFQFENDEETGETKPKDVEVECSLENKPYFQTAGSVVVSSSWLADVVSAGLSSVPLPRPLFSSSSLESLASTSVLSSRALSTTLVSIPAVLSGLKDSHSTKSRTFMMMKGKVSLKEYNCEVKFDPVSFTRGFWTNTKDVEPVLWPPDSGIVHRITGSDILLTVRL